MIKYMYCLALFVGLAGCGKENNPTPASFPRVYQLQTRPEALPAFDASNYGIYKGVVINAGDSAATFKINLYNGSNVPYASFYRNGQLEDSLVRYKTDASGLMTYPQRVDTAAIPFNASFYYTYFASYNIGVGPIVGFNTTAGGATYHMETQLFNNQTLNAVLKEKSDQQVYCFEGAYSGVDSGRIAFTLSSDSIVGIRASIWNPQFFKLMTARVSSNTFTINQFDDISGNAFVFTGSIQGTSCVGTWTRSSNPGVSNVFSARRTL